MPVTPEQAVTILHDIAAETGGKARLSQDRLAAFVACAVGNVSTVAVEAPTGTGKSRGAVLPLLLSGDRTVASTGTKALQDQYRDNDLPVIVDHLAALGLGRRSVAVLKGRANYPCKLAADAVLMGERQLFETNASGALRDMAHWAMTAEPGSEWQHSPRPTTIDVRVQLSAGPDECLGKRCMFYGECHAEIARKRAATADIVLVNHALLAANAAYGGKLIPVAEDEQVSLLIDEAHMLEQAAERTFGAELSMRGSLDNTEHGTLADIAKALRKLNLARSLATDLEVVSWELRTRCDELLHDPKVKEVAVPHAERGRLLGPELQRLSELVDETATVVANFERDREHGGDPLNDAEALAVKRVTSKLDKADMVASAVHLKVPSVVMFAERVGRTTKLVATDVNIGPRLSDTLWHTPLGEPRTVVLMSATIPSGYTDRIGLPGLETQPLTSPFDLPRRQLVFVADTLPSPATKTRQAWEQAAPPVAIAVADAALSTGSVLVLCTSWAMVKLFEERLRAGLRHLPHVSLFVDSSDVLTSDVVADFAAAERAVLISAQGAWTGIDLPGKVRAVIIPAAPMPVPGNPVNEARKELWPARWFPHPIDRATAAAKIAQGLGRLMRCEADWGVCAVLDPRLLRSTYAHDLRSKLPPQSLVVDDRYRGQVLDWLRAGGPDR